MFHDNSFRNFQQFPQFLTKFISNSWWSTDSFCFIADASVWYHLQRKNIKKIALNWKNTYRIANGATERVNTAQAVYAKLSAKLVHLHSKRMQSKSRAITQWYLLCASPLERWPATISAWALQLEVSLKFQSRYVTWKSSGSSFSEGERWNSRPRSFACTHRDKG